MENEEIKNDNQSVIEERIELFLKGGMSHEEAIAFRQELKENEKLRMEALSMALLIKGMQETGSKHDQAIIDEVRHKKTTVGTSKFKYYVMHGLAIAACICIVFTIYDYHDAKYETKNLAMTYINSYNPPLPGIDDISRGRGEYSSLEAEKQALNELSEIFSLVTKGEKNKSCIESLTSKFELAASDKLNNLTPYLKHIGYYLAIAQLQDNDRKAAEKTLQTLLKLEPDFKEAKELLKSITGIKCYWE